MVIKRITTIVTISVLIITHRLKELFLNDSLMPESVPVVESVLVVNSVVSVILLGEALSRIGSSMKQNRFWSKLAIRCALNSAG